MTKAPRLPDFTRLSWPSHALEEQYGPVIRQASQTWQRLELVSVGEVRNAALVHVPAASYPARVQEAGEQGRVLEVIDTVGNPGRYSSTRTAPQPGEAVMFRCALAVSTNQADRLRQAVVSGDDRAIGQLLGFPSCCVEAFEHTWGAGSVDSTWAQYGPTEALGRVGGSDVCNIVPRWLGVRLVPHLPCSPDCEATDNIGLGFAALAEDNDADGLAAIREVLSWAWQWSGLHGIARVTFPVVRVTTRTDHTAEEHVLEREGIRPAGTPSGLAWPFVRPTVLKVSDSKSAAAATELTAEEAQRATRKGLHDAAPDSAHVYQDNGFSSLEAMAAGHDTILEQLAGHEFRSVIDLGCGNGVLLQRIGAPAMLGIDHDRARLSRALTGHAVQLTEGDLCDPAKWWSTVDVALVPLRRFLDLERPALGVLKSLLRQRARLAVFYLYDQHDNVTGRAIFEAEGLDEVWRPSVTFPWWTHGAILCRNLRSLPREKRATSLTQLVRDGHLTPPPGATP